MKKDYYSHYYSYRCSSTIDECESNDQLLLYLDQVHDCPWDTSTALLGRLGLSDYDTIPDLEKMELEDQPCPKPPS
jgi:hypothetical protein